MLSRSLLSPYFSVNTKTAPKMTSHFSSEAPCLRRRAQPIHGRRHRAHILQAARDINIYTATSRRTRSTNEDKTRENPKPRSLRKPCEDKKKTRLKKSKKQRTSSSYSSLKIESSHLKKKEKNTETGNLMCQRRVCVFSSDIVFHFLERKHRRRRGITYNVIRSRKRRF